MLAVQSCGSKLRRALLIRLGLQSRRPTPGGLALRARVSQGSVLECPKECPRVSQGVSSKTGVSEGVPHVVSPVPNSGTGLGSVQKVSRECPRNVQDASLSPLTLRGDSRDTSGTPRGTLPWTPLFSGTLSGHSPGHSGPKGLVGGIASPDLPKFLADRRNCLAESSRPKISLPEVASTKIFQTPWKTGILSSRGVFHMSGRQFLQRGAGNRLFGHPAVRNRNAGLCSLSLSLSLFLSLALSLSIYIYISLSLSLSARQTPKAAYRVICIRLSIAVFLLPGRIFLSHHFCSMRLYNARMRSRAWLCLLESLVASQDVASSKSIILISCNIQCAYIYIHTHLFVHLFIYTCVCCEVVKWITLAMLNAMSWAKLKLLNVTHWTDSSLFMLWFQGVFLVIHHHLMFCVVRHICWKWCFDVVLRKVFWVEFLVLAQLKSNTVSPT